jgi:hypothetical protein
LQKNKRSRAALFPTRLAIKKQEKKGGAALLADPQGCERFQVKP